MNKGLIVAITGQSGSGKSSLSKIYAKLGYTVIDCDEVASKVHLNTHCIAALVESFGEIILGDNLSGGRVEIDKKKLSKIAFSTQENLKKLTEITHPFIIQEILRRIKGEFEKGSRIVFVDGAVIIGHEFESYCDQIILVVSTKEKQYQRLVERDNITLLQAKNRVSKQLTVEIMASKADYIVDNNSTQESLTAQAENIINHIIEI